MRFELVRFELARFELARFDCCQEQLFQQTTPYSIISLIDLPQHKTLFYVSLYLANLQGVIVYKVVCN